MLNIYNYMLLDINNIKYYNNNLLILNTLITKIKIKLPYNKISSINLMYTSGLFLKINNRLSTWFRYLNSISNTSNIRDNITNSVLNKILQSFFLLHVSMLTATNSIESFRAAKLIPILELRFASFFFFNIIGNLFKKLKFVLGSINTSNIYFLIRLNCLYNNSGIWGKKRKVKKAKVKLYGITSKGDSLYKNSSIIS